MAEPDMDSLSLNLVAAIHLDEGTLVKSSHEARAAACAKLKHVKLDRLGLHDLDGDVLKQLPSCSSLYLQDNRLTSTMPLAAMPQLTYLDLASNRLQQIDGLKGLMALVILDLSFNLIEQLNGAHLPGSLKHLKVAGNPCAKRAAAAGQQLQRHLPRLKELDGIPVSPSNALLEQQALAPSVLAAALHSSVLLSDPQASTMVHCTLAGRTMSAVRASAADTAISHGDQPADSIEEYHQLPLLSANRLEGSNGPEQTNHPSRHNASDCNPAAQLQAANSAPRQEVGSIARNPYEQTPVDVPAASFGGSTSSNGSASSRHGVAGFCKPPWAMAQLQLAGTTKQLPVTPSVASKELAATAAATTAPTAGTRASNGDKASQIGKVMSCTGRTSSSSSIARTLCRRSVQCSKSHTRQAATSGCTAPPRRLPSLGNSSRAAAAAAAAIDDCHPLEWLLADHTPVPGSVAANGNNTLAGKLAPVPATKLQQPSSGGVLSSSKASSNPAAEPRSQKMALSIRRKPIKQAPAACAANVTATAGCAATFAATAARVSAEARAQPSTTPETKGNRQQRQQHQQPKDLQHQAQQATVGRQLIQINATTAAAKAPTAASMISKHLLTGNLGANSFGLVSAALGRLRDLQANLSRKVQVGSNERDQSSLLTQPSRAAVNGSNLPSSNAQQQYTAWHASDMGPAEAAQQINGQASSATTAVAAPGELMGYLAGHKQGSLKVPSASRDFVLGSSMQLASLTADAAKVSIINGAAITSEHTALPAEPSIHSDGAVVCEESTDSIDIMVAGMFRSSLPPVGF